jgi:hypothetical protein
MNLRGVIDMLLNRAGPARVEAAAPIPEDRHERSARVVEKTTRAAETARDTAANWNAEVRKADRVLTRR